MYVCVCVCDFASLLVEVFWGAGHFLCERWRRFFLRKCEGIYCNATGPKTRPRYQHPKWKQARLACALWLRFLKRFNLISGECKMLHREKGEHIFRMDVIWELKGDKNAIRRNRYFLSHKLLELSVRYLSFKSVFYVTNKMYTQCNSQIKKYGKRLK